MLADNFPLFSTNYTILEIETNSTMAEQKTPKASDVVVEIIDNEQDFTTAFAIASKCFGEQTNDLFWKAMNPGWDTLEGAAAGTNRMIKRWQSVTVNEAGKPNTVHLKATVPDPNTPGQRVMAGIAIWAQHSMVDGMGDKPSTNISTVKNSSKNKLLIVSKLGRSLEAREISEAQFKSVTKAIIKKIGPRAIAIIFFLRINLSILSLLSFWCVDFCIPCF